MRFEWRNASGALLSTAAVLELPILSSGTYEFFVTVFDDRGGETRDSVVLTVVPLKEIVLHLKDGSTAGSWTMVNDAAAASGGRAYDPNGGAPKAAAPKANPTSYAIVKFFADPSQTYKVWVRLKADGNNWANDSVFLQFSGAAGPSGDAGSPGRDHRRSRREPRRVQRLRHLRLGVAGRCVGSAWGGAERDEGPILGQPRLHHDPDAGGRRLD